MAPGYRWDRLRSDQIQSLAVRWLTSLQQGSTDEEVGQVVVMLGFLAPADQQWDFLVAAVINSTTDDQLGHVAAGPAECLLSRHGEESIARFEEEVSSDPRFARMLTGVQQHMMADDVWQRVQTLQATVDNRL